MASMPKGNSDDNFCCNAAVVVVYKFVVVAAVWRMSHSWARTSLEDLYKETIDEIVVAAAVDNNRAERHKKCDNFERASGDKHNLELDLILWLEQFRCSDIRVPVNSIDGKKWLRRMAKYVSAQLLANACNRLAFEGV